MSATFAGGLALGLEILAGDLTPALLTATLNQNIAGIPIGLSNDPLFMSL